MAKNSISLGRILNIPIGVDYSWFLIFILITWTLAVGYYPAEFKQWPVAEYWIVAAFTAILLFTSVLLHELGHSVVARHYKIPVRSITLFIFGGVAQIASEPPSATAEFWIAIAGPLVSFALGALFTLLQPSVRTLVPLFALAEYLAYINGALGLFNLIPGFPLDGGRVFRAIIWGFTRSLHRATLIAATVGRIVAFLFILYGVWGIFTGNFTSGLWIAFIGWFLESAANSQVQQQTIHELLNNYKVSQAMSHNYQVIPAGISLQQLADEYILGQGQHYFIVQDDANLLGRVSLQDIKKIPRAEWPYTSVQQAMTPVEQMQQVEADTDLWEAFEKMEEEGVNQQAVLNHGQVQGILSREDISRFLKILQELHQGKSGFTPIPKI